jgi:UMF1 family MFS transporter
VTGSFPDKTYQRRIRAWTLYDWANHGYVTVTATTFFPPYFVAVASPAFAAGVGAAQARDTASNVYAFAVSGALLAVAALAPIVGTVADLTGRRKRLLLLTTCLGAGLASAMVAVTTGRWVLALALYVGSQIAVNIALGLNSSLLQHLARPEDIDRSLALGYAMGYVGGGLLLAIATATYLLADRFGISRDVAVRSAFFAVGVWWLGFAIPLAIGVAEPPAVPLAHGATGSPIRDALIRLSRTLRDLRGRRELFTMLLAFWLYMEGIGAIILLATAYGAALGLPTAALIGTLLLTQFVAFPYALVFGRIPDPTATRRGRALAMVLWTAATLPAIGCVANYHGNLGVFLTLALVAADQAVGFAFARALGDVLLERLAARLDAKRAIILGLAIYATIPIWGYFLRTEAEFFLIGVLVGSVQGGTQALSRAVYAALSPRAKSGEFFGLYALSEKFAGILGPLLYGVVGEITHNPRASILSVALFLALGIAVLSRVDVRAGERAAAAEDAVIATARAAD